MKQPIRILAFSPTYYPIVGGTEKVIFELYSRLAKRGYLIDLVTPNLGGSDVENHEGFTIYRVGKKHKSRVMKFLMYQRYQLKKAKELAAVNQYDIVHCHYAIPSIAALKTSKIFELPLVLTEHHLGTGMDISDPKDNPMFSGHFLRRIYGAADKIVATSETQKRFIESVSGRTDTTIIGNGVDCKAYSMKKYDNSLKRKYAAKRLVITVSRLNKRKNVEDIVRCAGIVAKELEGVKFVVVGKGEEENNLRQLISEMGLEKSVILAGFVPESELPKHYATADLYVSTSKYEGFGITYCEAMASGTPVVAYDTEAARLLVSDNVGRVVEHDYKRLAETIISLLKDGKTLKKLSVAARCFVIKNHDWNNIAARYDDVFRAVVGRTHERNVQ